MDETGGPEMTSEDWNRFQVVMARYQEAFPHAKVLSVLGLADRFEALRPVDIEALEQSVASTVREAGDFFPSVALQYEQAIEWTKAERHRRADAKGLEERTGLTPEEAAEIDRASLSERERIRKLLAEPFVSKPTPISKVNPYPPPPPRKPPPKE
jgi:hypothetical protein